MLDQLRIARDQIKELESQLSLARHERNLSQQQWQSLKEQAIQSYRDLSQVLTDELPVSWTDVIVTRYRDAQYTAEDLSSRIKELFESICPEDDSDVNVEKMCDAIDQAIQQRAARARAQKEQLAVQLQEVVVARDTLHELIVATLRK